MSSGGSPSEDFAAAPSPSRRRRRGRRVLLVALIVAVVAGGLALTRLGLDGDGGPGEGWRRSVLPATGRGREAAQVNAMSGPVPGVRGWEAVGTVLDTRTGRHKATAWSSADGRGWRRTVIDGRSESVADGLAAGRGVLVAVGRVQGPRDRDGAIWAFDDQRWSRLPLASLEGPGDQDLRAVAAGPVGFVATGRDRGDRSSIATMFFSPDGRAWSQVGAGEGGVFGPGVGIESVAAGPTGVVAVGWSLSSAEADGAAWFSTDGRTWSRGKLGTGVHTGALSSVTATHHGFVAVGEDGARSDRRPTVWLSTDGAQWERVDSPVFGELPGARSTSGVGAAQITGPQPLFAVGGGFTPQVWSSADGREWSRVDLSDDLARGRRPLELAASDGETLLVGANNDAGVDLWRKDPGGTWVKLSDPGAFPSSAPRAIGATLARTPSGLALFASEPDPSEPARFGGTGVWTSPDGRTWRKQPDPTGALRHASLGPVTSWREGLVVAGDVEDEKGNGHVRGMVWTSRDGASWQRSDPGPGWDAPGSARILTSVAAAPSGLVAVGVSYTADKEMESHVWTSADGRSWRQVPDHPGWTGPGDQALSAICPLPGGELVAVGYTRSGSDLVGWAWTSPDGMTWDRAGGEGAAALGGPGTRFPRACVSTPGGVVVAASEVMPDGRDAAVWSSPDGRSWHRRGDASVFGGQGEQAVRSLAADGERVVAVGIDDDRAAVWYSLDAGVTWQRAPDDRSVFGGFMPYEAHGVAILGDRVVVSGVGGVGAVVWEGRLPRR